MVQVPGNGKVEFQFLLSGKGEVTFAYPSLKAGKVKFAFPRREHPRRSPQLVADLHPPSAHVVT